MHKPTAIQDLCSDMLHHQIIFDQETRVNLCISAGLIEENLTRKESNDWYTHSLSELAQYIREGIIFCSPATQDTVFFLLMELPEIVH